MALEKQSIPINFANGLDTITDSFQVQPGKFLSLENSVFDKGGMLKKRNGFGALTPLPNSDSKFVTTVGGNLLAIGNNLSAYSQGSMTWVDKGVLQPANVEVISVVRSNVGQSQADSVTHPNGLVCTVFTDEVPTGGGVLTPSYKYVITDSSTGQRITQPAVIPSGTAVIPQPAKVFLLGNYFVIVFTAGANTLQYVAINAYTPTTITSPVTISSAYSPGPSAEAPRFEGVVSNNNLYLAWNGNDGGGAVRLNKIDSTLTLYTQVVLAGYSSTILSLCVDSSGAAPILYVSSYDSATGETTIFVRDKDLLQVTAATTVLTDTDVVNLASTAINGSLNLYYEQANTYGYDATIQTNIIRSVSMTQAGVVGIPSLVARSLGLASKAFLINGESYVLGIYVSAYQPTYFLINSAGQVIVKLAYSNASASYYTKGLANVTVVGNVARFSYLNKALLEAVNKTQGAPNAGGVYSQTGVNTAVVEITSNDVASAEIGHDLHVTGGFMWMYDGSTPVEHGFNLWPDYVEASVGSGGALKKQQYYYVATYEWTDAQGNIHRSAPSLPIVADATNVTGRGVSFTSVFASGDTVLTVSSVENLYVGMPVVNTSRAATFAANTTITAVGATTITISNATTAASASAPGDNISTTTIASKATFTKDSTKISVTSTNGFKVGQSLVDTGTPANLQANTYITEVDTVNKTLTLSLPTAASSASDQIRTAAVTAQAYFTAGSTTLRVTSTEGFGVGSPITDTTVGGAFQSNTKIVAIDPVNYIITIDKPTVSGTGTAVSFGNAAVVPQSPGPGSTWISDAAPVVTVGDLIFYAPSNPLLPFPAPVTSTTIFGTTFSNTAALIPNGNSFVPSAPAFTAAGHTISQASVVLSATFTAGSTTLNVSSTLNLGAGMTITDLTTPGNLTVPTTITSVSPSTNTITISTPTLGATAPDIVSTSDVFSNTVNVPTLRLTYKIDNPVRIALYRWSAAQQTYYQVTPILDPTLNNVAADYVTYTDSAADSSILGNNILYTTGGVIENIAAPSVSAMTLFKSRLFVVDAEDRNLLWYSKQVIENTPVEMSDLFTIFVPPTTAAQGDTGPITALGVLDDKLIIFKRNAIYYMTGSGPSNTGQQNDFSEPIYITTAIGCENPRSIVFSPDGLMFESEKGIWLLDRSLGTTFIGAPVDQLTQQGSTLSAVNVPNTNQVRFMLDSGITLLYDYYYKQWGTFTNIPATSSTIYQNLHTYINARGEVRQETPNQYLDAGHPVLLGFTTSWLNLAGLQGYERAYYFYLLGVFLTPHKLSISIAYDYNSSPTQQTIITPDNYTPNWGGEQLWGSGGGWGGNGNIEQHRVFLQQQKCQAFQVKLQEIFDPSAGVIAGAGLTLSGLNAIVGIKSNSPRLKAVKSVG